MGQTGLDQATWDTTLTPPSAPLVRLTPVTPEEEEELGHLRCASIPYLYSAMFRLQLELPTRVFERYSLTFLINMGDSMVLISSSSLLCSLRIIVFFFFILDVCCLSLQKMYKSQ